MDGTIKVPCMSMKNIEYLNEADKMANIILQIMLAILEVSFRYSMFFVCLCRLPSTV